MGREGGTRSARSERRPGGVRQKARRAVWWNAHGPGGLYVGAPGSPCLGRAPTYRCTWTGTRWRHLSSRAQHSGRTKRFVTGALPLSAAVPPRTRESKDGSSRSTPPASLAVTESSSAVLAAVKWCPRRCWRPQAGPRRPCNCVGLARWRHCTPRVWRGCQATPRRGVKRVSRGTVPRHSGKARAGSSRSARDALRA